MKSAVPLELLDCAADRFWSKVDASGDCWLWAGATDPGGYGRFSVIRGFGWLMAHRVAFQLLLREIPEGMSLDHLCRVHRCVNPDHLEPVTLGENVKRSHRTRLKPARGRSHCIRGHEYTDATVRRTSGSPECRTCEAEDARERRRRKSEARAPVERLTCRRGHPYTPENTYIYAKRGERRCRTCKRELRRGLAK